MCSCETLQFVVLIGSLLHMVDARCCLISPVDSKRCRLLADTAVHASAPKPRRPLFAYLGLPILQYVKRDERLDFLGSLSSLIKDPRNIVVANNAYLSEEVLWQTGLRVPTIRIHGLHTNSTSELTEGGIPYDSQKSRTYPSAIVMESFCEHADRGKSDDTSMYRLSARC